jgi:hypothetical protein
MNKLTTWLPSFHFGLDKQGTKVVKTITWKSGCASFMKKQKVILPYQQHLPLVYG